MARRAFFYALMPPKSSEIAAETAARPPCPQLKSPQVAGRRMARPRRGRFVASRRVGRRQGVAGHDGRPPRRR